MRQSFWLVIILIIGITVRVVNFGQIPPGLNQDEASIGYESFATLKYGVDRNGYKNPVVFIAYGDGQHGLYAYLSWPWIALFGLNEFSTRLTGLFLAIVSLWCFYYLIKLISNQNTALISAFLLAIHPWHIIMSRWSPEFNILPAFFLFGVCLLTISLKKPLVFPIAGFFLALGFYTYGAALFFVPVTVFLLFSVVILSKKVPFVDIGIGVLVFLLISLPALLYMLINVYNYPELRTSLISIPHLTGSPRWSSISLLFQDNFLLNFFTNLISFLKLLLTTQFDGLIWNAIPEFGYLYLWSIPLMLFGLLITIKTIYLNVIKKQFNKQLIIFIWFIGAVSLGLISHVNLNRINTIYFPLIYFTAVGVVAIKNHYQQLFRFIIVLYLVFFILFTHHYFTIYPKDIGSAFFASFGQAINYATKISPQDKKLVITNHVNMPYIYVLFYKQIDPRKFANTVVYENPGADFQNVKSFDRYIFGIDPSQLDQSDTFIFHNNEEEYFNNQQFIIKRFDNFSVASKINFYEK